MEHKRALQVAAMGTLPVGRSGPGGAVGDDEPSRAAADARLPHLTCWIDTTGRDGPANMAWDQALHELAEGPWLRVYRWPRAEVTFGYFMPWSEVEPRLDGRPATRRWTGGGLVEHGDDWTFSLMVPRACLPAHWSPRASYQRLHQCLLEALGQTIPAASADEPGLSLADREDGAGPGGACFERPVTADLMAGNRKVAGGAQRRGRCGLLHQGSVRWPGLQDGWVRPFAALLARRIAWVTDIEAGGSEPLVPGGGSVAMPTEWSRRARELAAARYACHSWTRAR